MKAATSRGVFLVLACALSGCGSSQDEFVAIPATTSESTSFEQHAYFKDDVGNRVFALVMPPKTSAEEAKLKAADLPHTPGHITAAYFYRQGDRVPADVVTLARNYWAATTAPEMEGLSRYSFAAIRGFDGNIDFADCNTTPTPDLCKPAGEH